MEDIKKCAKENLKFWKTLVGLPENFPKLFQLDRNEILDMVVINPDVEKSIMNSLSSKPITQVVVQEGGGTTTLYNYIFQRCSEKTIDSLVIPIAFDFASLYWQEEAFTAGKIEEEIKLQVIGNLVENPWENKLEEAHYFYCINYQEDCDFYSYRAKMRRFLYDKRPSYREVCRNFPFAKEKLDEFINYLLKNLRMQTVIFFHFPRQMDEQHMMDFVSAIKILYERNSFLSAAVREIYFCTPKTQKDLDREYKRDYAPIKYPMYTPAQIFKMLVKRYRPTLPGSKGRVDSIDLASVFSEEFVSMIWNGKLSLVDVISKVEDNMLEKLNCEQAKIPYRLEPVKQSVIEDSNVIEEVIEDNNSKIDSETAGKIKFSRNRGGRNND